MSNEISVKVGTKLSEAEWKAVDPKEIGRLQAQPSRAEVEGQGMRYVVCPVCGCMGAYDKDHYDHCYCMYSCHCCGNAFRV